jgi:hypothetical protein
MISVGRIGSSGRMVGRIAGLQNNPTEVAESLGFGRFVFSGSHGDGVIDGDHGFLHNFDGRKPTGQDRGSIRPELSYLSE